MSTIRIGDWVQFTPDAIRRFERFLNTIDRASAGMGATLRPNLRDGQWGCVVPPPQQEGSLKLRREPDMVAVMWPDGKVEDTRAGNLTRYECSPTRQVLADWLRQHDNDNAALRVTHPEDARWQRSVCQVWWKQPEARTLCEATEHPWLWGGVWSVAVMLAAQQAVRAERTAWGLLLSYSLENGTRASCPIGEGIWPTPESVVEVVELMREDGRMKGVTTTQAEGV